MIATPIQLISFLFKSKGRKKFDPEGSGYDDATAKKYGYKPTPDAKGKMHMQSRSPETGLLLKGRKHKTWNLLEKGEKEAGYTIYKGKDGRYYSKKKNSTSNRKTNVTRGIAEALKKKRK